MKIHSQNIILTFIFCIISLFVFAQTDTDEQLAAQYFQNKEYDKAIVLYERLFEKNPTPFYYDYYFSCLMEIKDFKKAEKIVKKQIKQNPNLLKYDVDLGNIYARTGDESKAKKQYESAIKDLQPDENQVLSLATAFQNKSLPDYAIKTYKAGSKLLKNPYAFNLQVADIYEKKGNFQLMIDEYLDLLEAGPQLVSEMQNRLQQFIVSDNDESPIGKLLKENLLKRTQQNPNKTIYSEMLLWLSIQQKDFESALVQAKSLDKRMKEAGNRVYDLAKICTSNKNYNIAAKAYEYVISKGSDNYFYMNSRIELLNVKFLKITSSFNFKKEDLISLESEYISALNYFGKSEETINLIKDLAHLEAFYLGKNSEAINLLNDALNTNASPLKKAECKIELADINLMSGEVWDASLLYSQVEKDFKDEPIGHTAKFKNAKLSYYIGEFKWAKAQLDVLKAATSKLIANDAMELSLLIGDVFNTDSIADALRIYARADLLSFQNKNDLALETLDSIPLLYPEHPLNVNVLYKKADIKITQCLYNEADSLLQRIVDFYPQDILADDALFRLAELNELQFKNKDKAMKLYEKIIIDYPGSLYVVEARKHFRKLRGDIIN